VFGLFNDKCTLLNCSHRSNNIANKLHNLGSHIYYVNSITCFGLLGHFHGIEINVVLYHGVCVCVCVCVCVVCVRVCVCVCGVCPFCVYDFINWEYTA